MIGFNVARYMQDMAYRQFVDKVAELVGEVDK